MQIRGLSFQREMENASIKKWSGGTWKEDWTGRQALEERTTESGVKPKSATYLGRDSSREKVT